MFTSNSAEETIAAGAECGRTAVIGNVFALQGDVGAGKTQFAKGFVRGVGSSAVVTSPTFTLVHEYVDGRAPLYHFDFYRIAAAEALFQLGFEEYIYGDGICLIEWADRFPDLLPANAARISIEVKSETERIIHGLPNR
jgi:tRNA threonylcarbamoyladenosine biosynthesis protein TsaE